jgi:hypothetical protein
VKHIIPLTRERHSEALEAVQMAIECGDKAMEIRELESDRSTAQNRLAFKLYQHIDKHAHTTNTREVCKYHIGLPILIADNPDMHEKFKNVLEPLPYEARIKAMELVPVTSLMKIKQFTEYLEGIYRKYDPEGYRLPKPEDIYYEAMGYAR